MKYAVTMFINLAVALKELERFVRSGEHLHTGKPFKKFGDMRSREMLANWLLCAALNSTGDRELTFSSRPVGGDGIISDRATGEAFALTEHVMASGRSGEMEDAQTLILNAIEQKRCKGEPYAGAKTLIVFWREMRGNGSRAKSRSSSPTRCFSKRFGLWVCKASLRASTSIT
jgi:hypothetical protein